MHKPEYPTFPCPLLSPSIPIDHLHQIPNLGVVSLNLAGRIILLRMVALLSNKKFERAHHYFNKLTYKALLIIGRWHK